MSEYGGYSSDLGWTAFSPHNSGWTSLTSNVGFYTVIGALVLFTFEVIGTSNSTSKTINLPLPCANFFDEIIRIRNNGLFGAGLLEPVAPTTTAPCYATVAGGGWTASGACEVRGSAFYTTA